MEIIQVMWTTIKTHKLVDEFLYTVCCSGLYITVVLNLNLVQKYTISEAYTGLH